MARPANPVLYERVKRQLYAEMPQHSAYRSGLLVQRYKAAGGTYTGAKPKTTDPGLARWYAEEWRNQRGGVGYEKPGDVYRPTQRVTCDTPTTFAQLTPGQVRRASEAKRKTGTAKFAPSGRKGKGA